MVSGFNFCVYAEGQSKELHLATASQHLPPSSPVQAKSEQSMSSAPNFKTVLSGHAKVLHLFNRPQQSSVEVSSHSASLHIKVAALLKCV
jgi:hypothetical protein